MPPFLQKKMSSHPCVHTALQLTIPRIVYVNCLGADAEAASIELGGVQVKRDLPHGRRCHALYEVSLSERRFQRNEKALALFLSDPQVEGVYETQTPLWLRAVLHIGCVTKMSIPDPKLAASNKFRLNDLEFVSTSAHPYLTSGVASLRRVYLYYATDKTRYVCLNIYIYIYLTYII